MDQAHKIIEEIIKNTYIPENWNSLPPGFKEQIFRELENRVEDESLRLVIDFLYKVSTSNDEKIKLLSLAIRSPLFPAHRKQNFLKHYSKLLEQVEERKLPNFIADYYALSALIYAESGNFKMAVMEGTEAEKRYRAVNNLERAQNQLIANQVWEELARSNLFTIPSEYLGVVEKKLVELNHETKKKEGEITQLNHQIERCNTEIENLEKQIQYGKQQLAKQREQINRYTALVNKYEAVMLFLEFSPRLVTAPLWVEVLRLGLRQGELDDLALRALIRLTEVYPEESLNLLLEATARCHGLDLDGNIHPVIKKFLPFLNEIRQSKENWRDQPVQFAQSILEVWSTIVDQYVGVKGEQTPSS